MMEKLTPPTISPSSGIFDVPELNVEIAAPNAAEVVYTTDGSTPRLVHYNSGPPRRDGSRWRNTFYPPVRLKISIPRQVKAAAWTVHDGKEVLSDVAVATYVWTKVQTGEIVSISPQSKSHTWSVHYAYSDDEGTRHQTSVVIGNDIPGWASADESVTVPGPGFSGLVKLFCPEQFAWSVFGRGNQVSGVKHFFLAAQ